MKQKFLIGSILSLFLIIFVTMIGCGESDKNSKIELMGESSLSFCTNNTAKTYIMDYKDAQVTPDYRPLSTSFCLSGEKLYFVDNQGVTMQSICEVSLADSPKTAKLPIDLSEVAVDALAVEQNEGASIIYCLGHTLTDDSFLAAYTHEGELLWKKDFDEKLSKFLQENPVKDLVADAEGRIYALSSSCISLFDTTGEYQGKVECPGKDFVNISNCGDGRIYVTYRGDATFLAEVDFTYFRLSETKELIGDGVLYEGQGNTLLVSDGSTLYSCEPQKDRIEKLFEYVSYDISSSKVQEAIQMENGEIVMISWGLLNQYKPVEILSFRLAKEGELAGDGKQVITVLSVSPFAEELFKEVVVEFNKQSRDYKVVFETIPVKGNTKEDGVSATNTRLLAKESADLLLLYDYEEMELYQSQGALEDLTSYLEASEKVGKEDFEEWLLQCFEVDGKLYGLSRAFGFDTLLGRSSEMGESAGWTEEEMLDWLTAHPCTKAEEGLSKEYILELVLKGNLDAYADRENGKAYFETECFQKLLSAINHLEVDAAPYYDDMESLYDRDRAILTQVYVASFEDATGWRDQLYGDQMVYRGYPNPSGSPKFFLHMNCLSILSRSKCKEGAYAFLEYFVTSKEEYSSGFYSYKEANSGAREYFVNQKVFDEDEEREKVEKQIDTLLELMEYATVDTMFHQTIRAIVLEESQAYFQGHKTLEDTCRIIQNRVQLYLDEKQ